MPSPLIAILLSLGIGVDLAFAAHAGFHVQFPWMTRRAGPETRPGMEQYIPFCGEIAHSPQRYARGSRTFLSFSGHPEELVTVLYTRNRVPKKKADFSQTILKDVPIQPSGQLCVNITIPFQTEVNEMGVMYFEARDTKTDSVQYCVSYIVDRTCALDADEKLLEIVLRREDG
ncbi:hypothetical protein GMORB2_5008 [Geosmithia morbida]|uniref:Uncharacterized protein n=1 Tax=Geosmithia morbida TaxID=1094350 RepID=A0A9P4YYX3_9HYPO|nr:uncharacterized protein GMORB2_5008 [Geosmithia morbida]KAF4124342.1 hypothetical protein GMORB2_5008 [Geosmithia morbida]